MTSNHGSVLYNTSIGIVCPNNGAVDHNNYGCGNFNPVYNTLGIDAVAISYQLCF